MTGRDADAPRASYAQGRWDERESVYRDMAAWEASAIEYRERAEKAEADKKVAWDRMAVHNKDADDAVSRAELAMDTERKARVEAEAKVAALTALLAQSSTQYREMVKALDEAKELLEWTEDDDWWCEPGFKERRDAFLADSKRLEGGTP